MRTLTATAILTTVGAALTVAPASAAPVATGQVARISAVKTAEAQAAKPAELGSICLSSDSARADDSCRGGERRVALRVDRPIALCRDEDGALTGGRCSDEELELTLPRNKHALLCASGRGGTLVHIERRSDCADKPLRAINHVPGVPRLTGHTVDENAGRVSVGLLSARNADLGDRITFRLRDGQGDDDNDLFLIRHDELFLTESVTAAEHPVLAARIQAVDLMGKRLGRAMTIRVAASTPTPTATPTAMPTASPTPTATPTVTPTVTPPVQPTTFALDPTTVAENAVALVGSLDIDDPSPASAPAYSITAGGSDFEIRNGTEVWTKRDLDHETTPTLSVTVRVTDNGVVDLTRDFDITVTNVDEDPSTIVLDDDTVAENAEALIGTLSVDDPDATSAPVFSITSGGTDLEVRNDDELWTTGLDFETTPTRTVGIHAGGTADLDDDFDLTITDVNEAPDSLTLADAIVPEHQPVDTPVGDLGSTDPDTGDASTHEFTLVTGAGSADNANFKIDGSTLRTAAFLDEADQDTHKIRVRVTDAGGLSREAELTITVDAINDAPTDIDLFTGSVPENAADDATVGTFSATDPDGGLDPNTYDLVTGAGDDDNALFTITGDTLTADSAFDFEAKSSFSVRVRVTDSGTPAQSFAKSLTITVTNVNEAPTDLALTATTIGENSANGTEIGTLTRTDQDDPDGATYTLVSGTGDTHNANFAISGNKLVTAGAFDFEATPTLTARIRITDTGGLTFEKAVTITVTDANDAPTGLELLGQDIDENVADGGLVGTLVADDQDGIAGLTYALVAGAGDADNAAFAIASGNKLSSTVAFNYETKARYDLRVRVTDSGTPGLWVERMFSIDVNDVNEAPTSLTLADDVVPEHQPAGTPVGDLDSSDPDGGDTSTFTLVAGAGSADNGTFEIDGTTIRTTAVLDEAAKNAYSIRVRVTDSGGLFHEAVLTITVDEFNDAPTDLVLSSTSIAENAAPDSTVGTFSPTDPDGLAPYSYELVAGLGDDDNAAFDIAGNALTADATFDFEGPQTDFDVRVRVTDTGTPAQSFTKTFTITVTNVNEAPTAIDLSADTVAENAANGTEIGTLTRTDQDTADGATYMLVAGAGSANNAKFAISGTKLVVNGAIDFEATPSLTARVRITDTGGLTFEKAFTITVTDVNEAPTDLTLDPATIAENQPVGSTVGVVSAIDPEQLGTETFALPSGVVDNASFSITVDGTLRTEAAFDFETRSSYTVRVRVTDAGGLSHVEDLTVTVTNVNEAPTDVALSGASIPENSGAGTSVGTFTTTDGDGTAPYTYALVTGTGATDNGSFSITGNTLTAASDFNFEAKASYTVRVRATDQGGLSYEKALTVDVTDVNEQPSTLTLSKSDIDENRPADSTVGTFDAIDVDAGSTFTFDLVAGAGSTDNGAFTVTGNALVAKAGFNFEVKSSYDIRVRVTDNGTPGLWTEQTFTIQVNDVNDAPTVLADSYGTAIGNTLAQFGTTTAGPVVTLTGALPLLNDSDEDGDPIVVTAGTYTGSAGGSLSIDAGGAFTFLPQVGDASQTDTFSYPVSDGTASTTATLSIAIASRRIWWVDDSAGAPGSGLSTSPYTTLTPLNSALSDADSPGDEIFVYAGTYSTGLVLEANQTLNGEGRTLTGLVPAGTRPTISAGGTTAALALGNSTLVRGLNLTSSGTGAAISGNGSTSASVASDVIATGGAGYAVDVSSVPGTVDIDIDATVIGGIGGAVRVASISAGSVDLTGPVTQATAGNPRGIDVSANGATVRFDGVVTLTTGTTDAITSSGGGVLQLDHAANQVTTTTGTGVLIGNGAGNVSIAGTITSNNATGQPLRVTGHTGGTINVAARLNGSGITMSTSSAVVNLAGRLALATTTAGATGLVASGGGSITAADVNNTVATTTGRAVDIVGTSIGAADVVFRSVSSNGATNGIRVENTGTGGNLQVLGSGAFTDCGGVVATGTSPVRASLTSSPVAGHCTGGTITGSTGAGVRLVNTAAPTLTSLLVQSSQDDGIELAGISGSARIADSLVSANGNGEGDNGVDVTGSNAVVGDVTLVDSAVDDSYDSNVTLTDRTTLVVSKSIVTRAGLRGGASGDGVQAIARSFNNPSLQVIDSVLQDNLGDHVQVNATNGTTMNQTLIRQNSMTTSSTAVTAGALGGGVVVATSGDGWAGNLLFAITNNSVSGARTSAITISQTGSAGQANLHGTVTGNDAGGTGANSCSASGSGVDIRNRDGAGHLIADVANNSFSQCSGPAISIRATGGSVDTQVTVTANTVSQENGTGTPQKAFRAVLNTGPGDTNSSCLDLSGTVQAAPPAGSIEVQSHPSIPTKLVGYTSGSAATVLTSRNNSIPALTSGAFTSPAGNPCTTP